MGEHVLILPMRNGNVSISFTSSFTSFCSYPTYEEWKLSYLNIDCLFFKNGSYPTYEEWKQEEEEEDE